MITWLSCSVLLLPWVGALSVWMVGDERPASQHRLASVFALCAGLLSFGLIPFISDKTLLRIPVSSVFGDFTLVADGMGVLLTIIAASIGGLAVLFSNAYMKGEKQLGRYYSLVLIFIGAMVGLVLSGSLLFMFIYWEITAFCSYALISFHNDDPKAVAGGIKALIITQFGGIGLLTGALLIYSYTSSYQINDFLQISNLIPPETLQIIGFGFLVAATAKSAQVPFHTWLPDAMEAPTPVSALIHAATMVNAGIYLLARFYPAFVNVPGWTNAIIIVGLVSAFLACLMALATNDLKRTLAYSTISQLGFMLYAIGNGGLFASQFHLVNHAIFKALLFLGAGAVIHTVQTRDMRLMGGLQKFMPLTSITFIIGSFGLAGLPIANGFFSKELILEAGLNSGLVWAYAGMIVAAGITAAYTFRMNFLVFFGNAQRTAHHAPLTMRITLITLAVGTLTTGFLAGPISNILANSLPYHEIHAASTLGWIREIVTSSGTWLAIGVVLLGLAAWMFRDYLSFMENIFQPINAAASHGYGFDWLNQRITLLFQTSAAWLQKTQTGQLNWNLFGIAAGLILILSLVAILSTLAGSV